MQAEPHEPEANEGIWLSRVAPALVLACILGLVIEFGFWTYRRWYPGEPDQPAFAEEGFRLPSISVQDLAGMPAELRASEPGTQATILVLLTTSCPYCRSSVPNWNAVYRRAGSSTRVVGLSLDNLDSTRRFVEEFGLEFPVFVAVRPLSVRDELEIPGVPQTIAIDAGGAVRGVWGGELRQDHLTDLQRTLRRLAPEPRQAP
jgi:peroxiredoxin